MGRSDSSGSVTGHRRTLSPAWPISAHRVLAASLLSLCAAGPLRAQAVHATLVEAGGTAPVDGAFVSLTDSTGTLLDRDLADADGTVTLTAPSSGRYRLLAERIGFATGVTPLFDLVRGDTLRLRVPIPVRPVELATLRVGGDAECRPDRVGERPAATLWDEARKALEAVAWSRDRAGLGFRVRLHDRRLDRRGRVEDEESRDLDVDGLRPFATLPAEVLARQGFVRATETDTVYFGPDAEVLLADAFAETHCFRSLEGEEPGRIGLGFEPLDRERPDVAGVLWLDARTAELRSLEFRYTGDLVSAALGRPHTGRMAFRRLPSGHWIVDEWAIRIPRFTRPLEWNPGPVRVRARRSLRFVGWWERSGEVTEVLTR